MTPHKLRKTRKKRGSRTCGYGQVGQHRKGGSKGMKKSGFDKHAWTYVLKYEPDYFGKRGFTSPRSLGHKKSIINVGELEELTLKLSTKKLLEKKEGKIFLDLEKLGYNKLLAKGSVSKPVIVKVSSYSKDAAKKIEDVGGRIMAEVSQLSTQK